MIEDRQISVETSGGYRPPSGVGERILVVIAGLALLGGGLIAVTRFLPESDAVADASPHASTHATATARPSRTPRPRVTETPFPDPPPIVAVQPGTPQPDPQPPPTRGAWALVLEEMPVLSSTGGSGSVVQTLEPGAVVRIDEYREGAKFLQISAPEPAGWVPIRVGGRDTLDVRVDRYYSGGADVWQLQAGGQGYVALTAEFGETPRSGVLASADGLHWTRGDGPSGNTWDPMLFTWGPAGWLAATYVTNGTGQSTWISRSDDGLHWMVLGRLDLSSAFPVSLVASREGYLLQIGGGSFGFGGGDVQLWFSPDGRRWELRPVPAGMGGQLAITGTPGGFLAWPQPGQGYAAFAAFSPDGFDWQRGGQGPDTVAPLIAAPLGDDRIVALNPGSGTTGWIGVIRDGTLTWSNMPVGAAFAGSAVVGMSGYGDRVLAIGWSLDDGAARTWTTDGGAWRSLPTPAAGFGWQTRMVVAGPAGYVVVGARPSLQASNPVFWRGTDAGWQAEPSPVLEAVGDPDPATCPPEITHVIDYLAIPAQLAIVCFGDRDVTFDAWASPCDGCLTGPEGHYREEWLANPQNSVFLGPYPQEDGGWYGPPAVLAPGLEEPKLWPPHLHVTGHWDDPAASRCTRGISARAYFDYYGGYPGWYGGNIGPIKTDCRMRFVVTDYELLPDSPKPSS